ncbi:M23 family metallopeptidase [Oceaniglobus roseus]|uniref:M23 family metallopeptidase n=1 Tax=Oceaniglobus roseus TaxID=1737570 RepID=UPI000C7F130C|nr:M23 family metallopeptidase [Kandeliimicrobium roseum]
MRFAKAPAAAFVLTWSLASLAEARDPLLNVPVDCKLGDTCHIQQYTDSDPGPGAADYTCGPLSYDGHKGTDFALPSLAAAARGVDVYPAAPGTVTGVRDGMEDVLQGRPDSPDVSDRECGNGVVLSHGDGWETQYCHMKRGSVKVRRGQRVTETTVLGQVGYSGMAEFPHLHLSVRQDGQVVDPFNPTGATACDSPPERTLWQDPPAYHPGGLISAGFGDAPPDYDAVRAGTYDVARVPPSAPALVLWGFAYGGREGDVVHLSFGGPDGAVIDTTATLEKDQAQFYRAAGKRTPPGGWPAGLYRGEVTMLRDGKEIDRRAVEVTVAR